VDDALFETLDPTTRRVECDGHEVLLSDTVGFIRHLPHQLVEAFSATLEEVRDADLILHVADASEPESRRATRAAAVAEVLDEIGAGELPRLLVLNKIDLVDAEERAALARRHPDAIRVSARTGEGLTALGTALAATARARLTRIEVTVPFALGGVLAAIYEEGSEVEQQPLDDGTRVRALMPPAAAARIRATLSANGAWPGDGSAG
jgi:GTP-binding protein HflX